MSDVVYLWLAAQFGFFAGYYIGYSFGRRKR